MSATVDAATALGHVDLSRRDEVRTALAATLVKRPEDLSAFASVFDYCFPYRPLRAATTRPTDEAGGGLRDQLAGALTAGDSLAIDDLARRLVERYTGLDAARASERYHVQRLERTIDLSGARQQALRQLDRGIGRAEIDGLLQRFRRDLLDEVRRRLTDELDMAVSTSSLEEIDFLRASTTELRAMRSAVRPLARRLAARLASHDRRHRKGRVDVRRTIRASLSSGGVPLDPAYRHRRRTRPDVWLLCDVSGSVAEFARFTLMFVYAMHEEFSHLRTFVFVDDVEEVTRLLEQRAHDIDPFALLVRASASPGRRRSDYGRAIERFWSQYGGEVGPWATVIFTGDARTHATDPQADVLRALTSRARHVWFLNPEPRATWDRGDSVASLYGGICHRMAEVRNLRQLAACVADLA
jgi:uncharacterized protein